MQNFLIYIFETSILTSIFFLFYRYMYYKLAYFVWNRYFFYVLLFASIIIPFLPSLFATNIVLNKIIGISQNTDAYINVENSFLNDKSSFLSEIPFVKVLFIVWLSGFIRYSLIILKSIFSILKLKSKSSTEKKEGFNIIKTNSKNPAFSFFKNIFVNNDFEKLKDEEKNQILNHEKIHAKQNHTIDNLIFEIFRAFFWFNPISKMIVANVKINHEFIVDNEITGNKNIPKYSRLILKLASNHTNLIGISNFSKEEIKSRIKIISSPENEKIRKKRFAISIPVLIFAMFSSWIIISTTNIYALSKNKKDKLFNKPFNDKNYKIISPFFINKHINKLNVSHKEVSYELKSFSNIYSVGNGIITNIEVKDIFGLKEYTITQKLKDDYKVKYKGLYKPKVKINEKVKTRKIIGIAGDIRLYPKIDIEIVKNKKPINPEELY